MFESGFRDARGFKDVFRDDNDWFAGEDADFTCEEVELSWEAVSVNEMGFDSGKGVFSVEGGWIDSAGTTRFGGKSLLGMLSSDDPDEELPGERGRPSVRRVRAALMASSLERVDTGDRGNMPVFDDPEWILFGRESTLLRDTASSELRFVSTNGSNEIWSSAGILIDSDELKARGRDVGTKDGERVRAPETVESSGIVCICMGAWRPSDWINSFIMRADKCHGDRAVLRERLSRCLSQVKGSDFSKEFLTVSDRERYHRDIAAGFNGCPVLPKESYIKS